MHAENVGFKKHGLRCVLFAEPGQFFFVPTRRVGARNTPKVPVAKFLFSGLLDPIPLHKRGQQMVAKVSVEIGAAPELTAKVSDAVDRYNKWIERFGETSYDFQTFYASDRCRNIRLLYHRQPLLGTVAVAPIISCEASRRQRARFSGSVRGSPSRMHISQWDSRFYRDI